MEQPQVWDCETGCLSEQMAVPTGPLRALCLAGGYGKTSVIGTGCPEKVGGSPSLEKGKTHLDVILCTLPGVSPLEWGLGQRNPEVLPTSTILSVCEVFPHGLIHPHLWADIPTWPVCVQEGAELSNKLEMKISKLIHWILIFFFQCRWFFLLSFVLLHLFCCQIKWIISELFSSSQEMVKVRMLTQQEEGGKSEPDRSWRIKII